MGENNGFYRVYKVVLEIISMDEKDLRDRPLASAQKLFSFLKSLPQQAFLSPYQYEALSQDTREIENLISLLSEATSREDWQTLWNTITELKRRIGGYVGNELGQNLDHLVETLWIDVLNSYSEIMK